MDRSSFAGPSSPPRYSSSSVPGSPETQQVPGVSVTTVRPATSPTSETPQYKSNGPPRLSLRRRTTFIDEILPVPSTTSAMPSQSPVSMPVLRRTASVAVIAIFLLSTVFLATTASEHTQTGLRAVFAFGTAVELGVEWVASEITGGLGGSKFKGSDFERYKSLQTLSATETDLSASGKRMIFVGDVHGSYAPLQRLVAKLDYDPEDHRLIHVGDLIAKGSHNTQVLDWMIEHKIQGVRGNHDQPVIQWRAWMEWAGGDDWKKFVDDMASKKDDKAIKSLTRSGKSFPDDWEWKGEHWRIAREITDQEYRYLVKLPLALHMPSLHSFVVHAGLLPHNPKKSPSAKSQPLVKAAQSYSSDVPAMRFAEELSVLDDVKQNTDPYTLLNIRSVFMNGKTKGEITKSSKEGEPWSDVWNQQMDRCKVGKMSSRKKDDDSALDCAPITVIYGHAAGRGLDIKTWSKGIDTGCVYGRQLTALVLGDLTGLSGEKVTVGEHEGLLVNVDCEQGGL